MASPISTVTDSLSQARDRQERAPALPPPGPAPRRSPRRLEEWSPERTARRWPARRLAGELMPAPQPTAAVPPSAVQRVHHEQRDGEHEHAEEQEDARGDADARRDDRVLSYIREPQVEESEQGSLER